MTKNNTQNHTYLKLLKAARDHTISMVIIPYPFILKEN